MRSRLLSAGRAIVALGATAALLALVPACGPEVKVPPPPTGAADLVLRTEYRRSLVPPWETAGLPQMSLYGDGRVIVPAHRTGALLVGREFRLTPHQMATIYRQAYEVGLDRSRKFTGTTVTDASQLAVTLATPDGARVTTLTVPGKGGRARDDVLEFARGLPAGDRSAPDYRPSALAALAVGPIGSSDAARREWPLETPLSGGVAGRHGRCTRLTGPDAERAKAIARDVAPDTPWNIGGHATAVIFRPMLPDEPDCAALVAAR